MDTRARKPWTLAGFEAGDLLDRVLAPIGRKDLISIYHGPAIFLHQFGAVNREQGLLWAAGWCMSEVCNGGFGQFFRNSTGVLAPEAVQGFRMIGARTMVRITSTAMAKLGSPYPRDRERRGRILKQIPRPWKKRGDSGYPFDKLDGQVYASEQDERFYALAEKFIEKNMDLFFK